MSTLLLKNINKIYDNNVQAVFDFNLEIKDKEFIVFVGPSGCGKSTTLRMVAGLESITSGQLYIDGKLMNTIAPKDRDIAMVFQNYALYPHMTVYDNMAFSLKLRKIPMPLYEENPEIDAITLENKKLFKEAHAINKKFKKNQNDLSFLEPRAKVYKKIYANLNKIAKIRKPLIGINNYLISKLEKTISKLESEIFKLKNLKEGKYSNDENALKIIEEGILQRQGELDKCYKDLDYYKNNEVPLTKLRNMTAKEIEVEINKTADSIDLTRYLYRKPAALSGGQRQRVALGRAIVRKPKVFLMDEPLSNLDAKLRVQTRSEISKIHEKVGTTTIYVTHDQTEAMTMADRIVVMKDGVIQQIGTPTEVYSNPVNTFVAGFIGAPAMNFINVELDKNKLSILNKEENDTGILSSDSSITKTKLTVSKKYLDALKKYDGKEIILGVRPENLYIKGDKNNENPSEAIHTNCDFAELLGYELILYTYVNGQKIIIKTDAKKHIATHDEIDFNIDNNEMYFFDKETGNRII